MSKEKWMHFIKIAAGFVIALVVYLIIKEVF
jgi:hypothetical protein